MSCDAEAFPYTLVETCVPSQQGPRNLFWYRAKAIDLQSSDKGGGPLLFWRVRGTLSDICRTVLCHPNEETEMQ